MKCIICHSDCSYYFSKRYTEPPFDDFMRNIGDVYYYKCKHCGFVISKTHCELDESTWRELNFRFHHYIENIGLENGSNQPPYAEQALMISLLGRNGIIDTNSMIDFAAGYGRLSKLLSKYFNLGLPIYDPYIHESQEPDHIPSSELKTYKTVINSAMFEHILTREHLDQVNSAVTPDGCLIIHTVVCENVPKDPNWFYLAPPVHTAFHTNRSMEILMEQWGYQSSIYAPKSKCWVLLRERVDRFDETIEQLNDELQCKWFCWKNGFVDYWKGF